MSKKIQTPKTIITSSNQKRLSLTVILPVGLSKEKLPEHLKSFEGKVEFIESDIHLASNDLVCMPTAKDCETQGKLDLVIGQVLRAQYPAKTVLVPCLPKPTKKDGVSKRIGFWFQGVLERLFTGIEPHHALSSCALFPTVELKGILQNQKAFENLSGLGLIRQLRREGIEINEVEIPKLNIPKKVGVLEFFKGFGTAIGLIKEEFVTVPLKAGLNIKNILSEGNNLFYRFKFFALAMIGLIFMLFISKDYNVTWDEETNQESAELVYNYLTTLGSDTTMFNFNEGRNRFTNQHYGISFDVGAYAVQQVVKTFNPNANIYAIRHFLNALVGFLIILFAGLLAWRLFDIKAGILAMFILFFSPSFFGHSFNNPKDIPFALGFIMGIYYLVRVILEWPKPTLQSRVMLSVGLGYCLSIRAGGLLLFAFVVLFLGVLWFLNVKKNPSLKPFLRYGIPVIVLGYILGIMLWPYALRQPLTGPLKALQEFENFSQLTYYELFEGIRMYIKPWHYIPKLVLITAPLVLLLGLPLLLLYVFRKKLTLNQKIALGLVIFSSVFPVAYTIYKGSYLYNGWRHMLFVYPGLVVVAALGWSKLMDLFKAIPLKIGVMAAFMGCTLPAIIWTFSNHPYQYMYFNETVGGVKGANGNYELDYWNQTPRAAMEWISKNVPEIFDGKIPVNSNNPVETLTTFVPGSDSIQYRWTREYEWTKNNWEYAIWTHRTLNKNQIRGGYWPPVGTIHTVNVDGVSVCAVVKRKSQNGYHGHRTFGEKKYDSAVYYFSKVLEEEPLEEEYHRGLAGAYRSLGQFDNALQSYKKALEIRDGNYEAYFGLGEIYYMQGANKQPQPDMNLLNLAEQHFKEALRYKQNYANANVYLGGLAMAKNDMKLAMKSYKSLISSNGNFALGWQGAARVFINLQQADSALAYLQVAMQLDPNQAELYLDIAKAFQLKGDRANAEKYQQEYTNRMQGGR